MEIVKFISCLFPIFYKPDCSIHPYNTDTHFDTEQIISIRGYSSEAHMVVTEDGYVLKLHRIPGDKNGKRNGQPVLLSHGVMGSSSDWLMNGNASLGYLLADHGYDVWMLNSRGNRYSAAHVSIPVQSEAFWDFSWHEMGMYDLPASINYVYNLTGRKRKVVYIGESMGSTSALVLASSVPEVANKINGIIAFAPLVFMGHVKAFNSFIPHLIMPIAHLLVASFPQFHGFDADSLIRNLLKTVSLRIKCDEISTSRSIASIWSEYGCWALREIIASKNTNVLPVVFGHVPAGTSLKTFNHFRQGIAVGNRFQQYDYSNGTAPKEYDLSKIDTPVHIFFSESDPNAPEEDIKLLAEKLKYVKVIKIEKKLNFTHTEFIYGEQAYEYVHKKVLELIEHY